MAYTKESLPRHPFTYFLCNVLREIEALRAEGRSLEAFHRVVGLSHFLSEESRKRLRRRGFYGLVEKVEESSSRVRGVSSTGTYYRRLGVLEALAERVLPRLVEMLMDVLWDHGYLSEKRYVKMIMVGEERLPVGEDLEEEGEREMEARREGREKPI